MRENHKKFLSHLNNSTEAVFITALYLHNKGLDVRINAMKKAKSHKDWKNFKDDGDMYIYKGDKSYRIEVKGLSCDFTNASDWAFKDFIVCAKHSYDNSTPKPYAYMILNKDKTHMGIVNTRTYLDWGVVSRKDSRYKDVTQEFYTCPLNKIQWEKII
jgi:hypothetical protein|tara:strand:- start:59 stop:532 length:474 start_codon:yes stop_codon:yes gene_type:complete